MDYQKLADLLFPDVTMTAEELEAKYPPRSLPEGAKVTRFAPSPTGFVHLGGVYQTMVDERLAHQSNGVFFLRIEDTDAKREIPGAAENLINTLSRYGIRFDEGAAIGADGTIVDNGAYGPYKQSQRGPIYHVFAKKLVAEGKAYPVFTTEDELKALEAVDKKAEVKAKEWTAEAEAEQKAAQHALRNFTLEDVEANLAAGNKFVLRILADGDPEKKTKFTDLVKGALEIPENDEDFVLLKSDGIPTYHFAHAVDDHLMRTTHVIRGEEWLPSVAKHIQLFRYLGFKLPKYLHTAQIMQLDANGNKKKLSKRDLGANMSDYTRLGYAPECVSEYLLTILNSNFEEWRMQNPDKHWSEFKFDIKKMSASGCLFDATKLGDVSKNVVSKMTADSVYDQLLEWANDYDADFAAVLAADPDYAKKILAIGRGGKKPRKDYGLWNEVKGFYAFFWDKYFTREDKIPANFSAADVKTALLRFADGLDMKDDANAWFEKVKAIAAGLGYATDMRQYKATPDAFPGSVADVSMFIRVAVTGRQNSPDLYTVIGILGADRTIARVREFANSLTAGDKNMEEEKTEFQSNFIHEIVDADLAANPGLKIHTRFPPEPNGYLHIGSAKAIRINTTVAKKYGGLFNLRYDDTNPAREDNEYVQSIYEDLKWLGCEPTGGVFYGSDYFGKCYEFAVKLIKEGKAYVDDLSADEMKAYRGTLTEPGKPSPYRDRTVEENLDLFERMKNGEFENGTHTLRAKIDMASPNMNLRDPAIYRIVHTEHHRQGNKWCIYPLYDFAHPIQDALEGITHSLCSIEFENHRPLYEWVVDNVGFEVKPKQREFARLNVTHTVMSKRYLRQLVETGLVDGWDDPRMPTLCGLRRRGYTPAAIFDFVDRAGVAKADSLVDIELLEHCIREELNTTALRRVAVAHPIKVVVDNFDADKVEYFALPNNPQDPDAGTREVPFTRELWIDADDFAEVPPPKFFRLKPDGEVRLMGAYIVKCGTIEKNADGSIAAIHVTADLETGCGNPADGHKIKGTIHWLSARFAKQTTLMLYDHLFTLENVNDMPEGKTYNDYLNPDSAQKIEGAMVEPSLADVAPGERFQFVRNGYYVRDTKNENTFNRIVGLKDSFPKK